MSDPLRLGIAGLGTVGIGVIKIVQNHADLLSARSGRDISISAISARSRKDRGVDLSAYAWEDNPVALAARDDVDVYIELMGGENGPAKASVEAALAAGKHVVTANKALLAHHGQELAEMAEDNGVNLRFEAAVAGGIPVIKTLTEGLAANQIKRVMGVMNGSCNYILTRMETSNLSYEAIFDEANGLGYLEADPELDVGGIDAAHKLALLSSIAFGTKVDFAGVDTTGIGHITLEDIRAAGDMGYKIKLLGVAKLVPTGLVQTMQPSLVPDASPLAQLEGGTNMVVLEGDAVGQIVMRGAGAGEGPTASAVMGDVMDVARGLTIPVFGQPASTLRSAPSAQTERETAFYIRLMLKDKAGALSKISTALGRAGISIDRMRQQSHDGQSAAPVLIVTHPTRLSTIDAIMNEVRQIDVTVSEPVALRIESV
jgi:homoserine dehydrogenase